MDIAGRRRRHQPHLRRSGPFQSEVDKTFWGRAALLVPVNATWALVPQVEIRDQDSNYEISKYDDFSTLVGLQKRF